MLDGASRASRTSTPTGWSADEPRSSRSRAACYVLSQVKGGKFVRVFPKKKGTFDCNEKDLYTIKLDLS